MLAPLRGQCFAAAILAASLSTIATAEVHRCTNEQGKQIFQDRPCPGDAIEKRAGPASPKEGAGSAKMECKPTEDIVPRGDVIKAMARTEIASRLKDPYSARFESLFYARLACTDGTYHTVCASVNAKNSFGAYVGSEIWVYRVDQRGRSSLWSAGGDKNILHRVKMLSVGTACVLSGE